MTSETDGTAVPANGAVDRTASVQRIWLDDRSWVDVTRGWLREADQLYETLHAEIPWRQGTMWRYERHVTEPRMSAWIPRGRPVAFPALLDAYRTLRRTYGVEFDGFGLSLYRDGADGVAFHRDREMRWLDDTVIAILTLGARRPFLIKSRHLPPGRRILNDPEASGARDLSPAGGDLIVLGGRAQADWLHAVPRVPEHVAGRISVQWRWTSRTGRPEQGPGYGAARHFSR
ncbi:DNA-N1-methyladenine dioxygenase [Frankia casuarinae]|uniref:DNA-N1-methyladenine dioxygenase n=1 Tax=Frankia casuarinae (strain DSM 45818 / CECT 9043 / HFP020203 / CcI3) TaxID=106370 RepID=Q2J5P6_FRACC|nr:MULTISPECIES: alpha-ketoglutarate-dependent dioxygenase AlkB [Frankia]ABD13396.1 DNA-N1-methyladenine dioxygenase [Frankia casuarinae]ETA02026.1 DNA-N1-methyladenine dioxygenase [Frankia sp. CcI6]EYT91786.1 DNA-N1-methyladenine dioxygenase [Frankia casuarinae]KDA42230.1 DNA-N1-methyladenine dioxygenase [Frankia sp. BMG5.23]KEZ35747.1 DNA-N1-methyladenine dioxygenase [Frankia sp. CeD]